MFPFEGKSIRRRAQSAVTARPAQPADDSLKDSFIARIILLDGEEVSVRLPKKSYGRELMNRICDGQDIIETDYFGLTYTDKQSATWVSGNNVKRERLVVALLPITTTLTM